MKSENGPNTLGQTERAIASTNNVLWRRLGFLLLEKNS